MAADKNCALLIVGISEKCPDLYYATKYLAPDSFVFMQIRGRKIMLASDLELDRAKKQARVDDVISISVWAEKVRGKTDRSVFLVDVIEAVLRHHRVAALLVPGDFPLQYADPLRQKGFCLTVKGEPFFEERVCKTRQEIADIKTALRHTQAALDAAQKVLAASKIVKNRLVYENRPLKSEDIKRVIHMRLVENNLAACGTIVSCGKDTIDPHCEGGGFLRPHVPILIDIFPRSMETCYCADISRTFVKGQASEKLKRMYAAVREAQEIAFERICDGADGKEIHEAILTYFDKMGFPSGLINGRMQGFFHGTGHGVGLEVHEPPRISKVKHILKAGQVVTVEPGLYYPDTGGVRLEDMVVVERQGVRNLTRYPKVLEMA